MNAREVIQAMFAFNEVSSIEELQEVLRRHPVLLTPGAVAVLRQSAESAQAAGQQDVAEVSLDFAERLEQLQQMSRNAIASALPELGANQTAWADWARRYLALRVDMFLERAVFTAHAAGDSSVAELLAAYQVEDRETIGILAPTVERELLRRGREEDARTANLILLDTRAKVLHCLDDLPIERRGWYLQKGVEACGEAAQICQDLGDVACAAHYASEAGKGMLLARSWDNAASSFMVAAAQYAELRDEAREDVYEVHLAETLHNLGTATLEGQLYEEAEQAFRSALTILLPMTEEYPELNELVAQLYHNLGNCFRQTQRPEEAAEALREALAIYTGLAETEPVQYKPRLAGSLDALGMALDDLGRPEEAEDLLTRALAIWREQPDFFQHEVVEERAMTLSNLATVLMGRSRYEEAEALLREALETYRPLAEGELELYGPQAATLTSNLGVVLGALNRLHEAEEACREALACYDLLDARCPGQFSADRARTLNALGSILQGSWPAYRREAGERHGEALDIYRRLAAEAPALYLPFEAATLCQLGSVQRTLEEFGEAARTLDEAVAIYRRLAEEQPAAVAGEYSQALASRGAILADLGRAQEAEESCREALRWLETSGQPEDRLQVLFTLGKLLCDAGRFAEAAPYLEEAQHLAEHARSEALTLDRRIRTLQSHVPLYDALALSLARQGRLIDAVAAIENGKSRTIGELIGASAGPSAELLRERDRLRFRARELEDEIRTLDLGHHMGMIRDMGDPDEILPEEDLRGEKGYFDLDDIQILVRAAERMGQRQLLERRRARKEELVEVQNRLTKVETQIRGSDRAPAAGSQPMTAEEILSLASDSETVLTVFRVSSDHSAAYLVFPDKTVRLVEAPGFGRQHLAEWLHHYQGVYPGSGWLDLYDAMQGSYEDGSREEGVAFQAQWMEKIDRVLRDLYDRLLGPVREALLDWKASHPPHREPMRLLLVPTGLLSALPLHACCWDDGGPRYLLDDFSITYAPNLTIFRTCLHRSRARAGQAIETALVVANPTGDLLNAEWESAYVASHFGPERCIVLAGDEATAGSVLSMAPDRNCLHFSCHGRYQTPVPLDARLVLGGKEGLTLGAILRDLRLPQASLVVLSACETSQVDPGDRADEHLGLPTGFLYAGAPTVYGTLWSVDDRATSLLMARAYDHLMGGREDKSGALRNAQVWLRNATLAELIGMLKAREEALRHKGQGWPTLSALRRSLQRARNLPERPFAHPYYWAAFQCVGA